MSECEYFFEWEQGLPSIFNLHLQDWLAYPYPIQYIQYYQLSIMERGVGYTLHKITGEVHVLATSDTQLYEIDASVS